jgi:GMP synthase (glutamine-hydrolysing)
VRSRLLVIQSDCDKPLGRIGDGLGRAGVDLDVRSPDRQLPAVRGYSGLVVLPGLANPVDEDTAVERARDSIHQALEARLPILGLCLGGQLLVQALGGEVYQCRSELGFGQVAAAAAAMCDPLLDGVPERFSVFHAHTYAFKPPSEAEILLSNDVCVQACRLGPTWAFQCHPEVSPEWIASLAAAIRGHNGGLRPATAAFFAGNGVVPAELQRDAHAAEPVLSTLAAGIASGFAAQLD